MTIYYPLTGKETVSITLDYRPYQGIKWIMKLQDNTTVAESLDRYSLEQYASKKQATIQKACHNAAHWDEPQFNCPLCK